MKQHHDKEKIIGWLINFIQIDLRKKSKRELTTIAEELDQIFFGLFRRIQTSTSPDKMTGINFFLIPVKSSDSLTEIKTLADILPPLKTTKYIELVYDIQISLKDIFDNFLNIANRESAIMQNNVRLRNTSQYVDEWTDKLPIYEKGLVLFSLECSASIYPKNKKCLKIEMIVLAKDLKEWCKIKFLGILSGVPLVGLRFCLECNRAFYLTGRWNKKYCTSKCARRASARRCRQADTEGYNKKQRDIMRANYRSNTLEGT